MKQNLGSYKFKEDRRVETVGTLWPIIHNFNPIERVKKNTSHNVINVSAMC
jgi:hypothetical protein